ncbi:MAG: DUF2125 domain-containing protein [Hyphomonas sp.]|nr:DUF2125 domain-containing protein [Hyphomonas sp.]
MTTPTTVKKPSRFWLFFPFVLLILAVGGWCAWWFLASSKIDQAVDSWIAEQQAAGAEFTYAGRSLTGFPFRFDVAFEKPHYKAADGAVWDGDTAQFVMQAWNLKHVIARAPGHHTYTNALGIRNAFDFPADAAASLSWDAAGPRRIGFQSGEASALIGGRSYDLTGLSLNFAPREGAPDDLMMAVQWDRIVLDREPSAAPYLGTELGPSRIIGEVQGFFPAYAAAGDLHGVWPELLSSGGNLEIAQLLVDWGPLDLGGKSKLELGQGRANGTIQVRLDNAGELKEAMIASGNWGTAEQTLYGTIEPASRNGGFLMLSVIDSRVFAGPVPLGTLPGTGS